MSKEAVILVPLKMIDHIKSLRYWLIPILSVLVGEVMVISLLTLWSVGPWRQMYPQPGFQLLVWAFMSVAFGMAFAVFVVTLVLNSWTWLMRRMLRRYVAQLLVGVFGLGLLGYAYSNLFWRALGESLLLLEHGGGIQLWAVMYLIMLNFAFVFMRMSLGFMQSGVSPRSGYLTYLLGTDETGRKQKVSLDWDVAYINSFDGQQQIFCRNPELPSLALASSLKQLAPKMDPSSYCWINRNYIVHWRAIRELRPEKNGRRLEVWLDPPSYSELHPGMESCTYVRKERVSEVVDWYQACLGACPTT